MNDAVLGMETLNSVIKLVDFDDVVPYIHSVFILFFKQNNNNNNN